MFKSHNKNKKLTIERENFLISLFFTGVIILILGSLFSYTAYTNQISSSREQVRQINNEIAVFTEGYFREIIHTIQVLAEQPEVRMVTRDPDPAIADRSLLLFDSYSRANQNLLYVYAGYETGLLLINDYIPPIWFETVKRPWYTGAFAAKPEVSFGVPYREASSDEWVIATSKAFTDETGHYHGVMAIESSMDTIMRLLEQKHQYESQISFVVDQNNKIIIHPDYQQIGFVYDTEFEHPSKRWYFAREVSSTGWQVVTGVERAEILAPIITDIVRNFIVFMILAFVLGGWQRSIIRKRFTQPLLILAQRLEGITKNQDIAKDVYDYSNPEIAGIAENIEKLATQTLLQKNTELQSIIDSSQDALLVSDKDGQILYMNQKFHTLWNLDNPEALDFEQIITQISNAFKDEFTRKEQAEILSMRGERFSIAVRLQDNRFVEIFSFPMVQNEEISGQILTFRDITEKKAYEEELIWLSLYDNLTNTYNRIYFEKMLSKKWTQEEFPLAIISLDIDGLKLVNDTMGHEVGDYILEQSALLLKEVLGSDSMLARIGGDEFAVLMPGSDLGKAEETVEAIKKSFSAYNTENPKIPISISMGIAVAAGDGQSLKDVFKSADDAMYRSKLYKESSTKSQIIGALLGALGERDYMTEGHGRRLEELSQEIGRRKKLGSAVISNLGLLAQVHDLGKVGIPDQILFKPGPLNQEEWEIMKQHPEKGYRIAMASPDLAGIADLILKHHEKWDGSGYPLGIQGEEIPVESRIIAIVDAYDAMTSTRPYSHPKTHQEALAEIKRCAGTQFDPELVDIFLEVMKEKGGF